MEDTIKEMDKKSKERQRKLKELQSWMFNDAPEQLRQGKLRREILDEFKQKLKDAQNPK